MNDHCEKCKNWFRQNSIYGVALLTGDCRRHAPIVVMFRKTFESDEAVSKFPETDQMDVCGDYALKV